MEKNFKKIVEQLSNPTGEAGIKCAQKMNVSNKFMTDETFKRIDINNQTTLLEIGPGNGLLSFSHLKELKNYFALDHSELMIKECKKNFQDATFNCEFFRGDLKDARFSEASNVAIGINLLYFIDDLKSFFDDLKKHLGHDAKVYFTQRSKQTILSLPHSKNGFLVYSENEIKDQLILSGFKDISIEIIKEPSASRQVETDVEFETAIISASN